MAKMVHNAGCVEISVRVAPESGFSRSAAWTSATRCRIVSNLISGPA